SDIMTPAAFKNAIIINTAIGGSSNAPVHINAIARHTGIELTMEDWQDFGYDVPLIVNCQPAGKYLAEAFHKAGGLPAVGMRLIEHEMLDHSALTVNGKTLVENYTNAPIYNDNV